MKIIIAEKPSVAKNIAEAVHSKSRRDGYLEGPEYLVTWAFGHLLELLDAKDYDDKMALWRMENFPFIPDKFRYKVKSDSKNKKKVDSGAKKQIEIIKSLIQRDDVDSVISACDYDREGQIIGDIILKYLKVKKPIYRILLNEWTPDEVVKGLDEMKPNTEMKPLCDAGISRQWADWTIGINLTSVATLKYQQGKGKRKVLNIGRVLLPTLKIIYDRDKEIEKFVPNDYYKLLGTFKTLKDEEYEGTYFQKEEDKFKDKKVLEEIKKNIQGNKGTIIDKQVESKKEYAPSLFNLSNLQGHITSKYKGFTSDKVLKVAQSLYEKKHITYPRTASLALEESLVAKAQKVLEIVKKGLPYEKEIKFSKSKRVFDNKKVESHSAIIPTYMIPKNLSEDEKCVYDAIKNRFIMQFMPIAEHEETKIETKVEGVEGSFISKGKVQIIEGWKKVEKVQSKDKLLPKISIKDIVDLIKSDIEAHKTKPPKHHTEKTLLKVMETCGKKYKEEDSEEMMDAILNGFSIGTPATRAETINKLKYVGYIKAKGKSLVVTEMGKNLVNMFPTKELFDLEYTGRLEKTLAEIEKGKIAKDSFLDLIFKFTDEAVKKIKNDNGKVISEVNTKKIKGKTKKDNVDKDRSKLETFGKCPLCGSPIIEGKRGFGCSNWKNGCKFVIWKDDKFLASMKKKVTKTMVKELLKKGKANVKGLTSKKGNKFDAILIYEKNADNNEFIWKMEFK